MTRPSETSTAIVGSVLGAGLVLFGSFTDFEISAEVAGALTTLVAWIATGITWYVARQQRRGKVPSAPDGSVQ